MADLLFCDLRRGRRERRFRTGTQCEIDDFTNEKLRASYRFRRESILFITNLQLLPVISVETLYSTKSRLTAAPSSFNCPKVLCHRF